jgi:hypothetical protein
MTNATERHSVSLGCLLREYTTVQCSFCIVLLSRATYATMQPSCAHHYVRRMRYYGSSRPVTHVYMNGTL